MKNEESRMQPLSGASRLIEIVGLCVDFCSTLESAREMERQDFINSMLNLLPRIYWNFNDLQPEVSDEIEAFFLPDYVDEEYYEGIRMRVAVLMGEDDTFLETFVEDMKYSDTPVGASVSESLADIFQPVYNFVERVRESDSAQLNEAYAACHDDFKAYWSQTLCNVLRALNALRYN